MSNTTTPNDPRQALSQLRERVTGLVGGFSRGQRTTLAVAAGAVVVLVLAVSYIGSNVEMAPLYTGLEASDVGTITKKLASEGVAYEITDGGSTVSVPKDQVYQLRADLAETVLPSAGKVGYGVLDDQGLTTSEFGQRIGFQRAMEGELAKTIEAINGVQTAVVHLAIPKDQVFALDAQKATASVMVKTGGKTLGSEQVDAIRNLVASGIEGLAPGDVSVADSDGHVLAAPGASSSSGSSGSEQVGAYEARIASQIENLLSATVGVGKVKATVSADLDLDQTSQVKETFEPTELAPGATGVIPLNESTKTETYGGSGAAPSTAGQLGSPDPATAGTPGAAGSGYSLQEAQKSNAVNKTVETTNKAMGSVRKLTVAVIVDDQAVSETQIAQMQQLVSNAAGIDTARGDAIVVSRMPFDQTTQQQLQQSLETATAADTPSQIPLYGAAGGLALLIAIATFIVLRKRKKDLARLDELAETAEQLSSDDQRIDITQTNPALGGRFNAGLPNSSAGATMTVESSGTRREVLGELIDNQPDEVAQLLRGWLADRRTVRR